MLWDASFGRHRLVAWAQTLPCGLGWFAAVFIEFWNVTLDLVSTSPTGQRLRAAARISVHGTARISGLTSRIVAGSGAPEILPHLLRSKIRACFL
jgi:hypothetical protein